MKLYLYLAKRNKKGIKILTVLNSEPCMPIRLTDVKKLKLSSDMESKISQEIHSNRLLWEAWIETADDFAGLKKSLTARGFSNLPLGFSCAYNLQREKIKREKKIEAPLKSQANAPKTMLRRKN